MDTLANLYLGLNEVLTLNTLFFCFAGVFLGTLIGVLPGIGSLAGISLLLPITYYIPPTSAIVMVAGVYYGSQYGNSVSAILLNLPGTTSSAVTTLDGHQMAKNGQAGVALFMAAVASFIGSMIGVVALILFSPAIAELGLKFGAAEYFATIILGLVAVFTLSSGSPLRGLAMIIVGLLLGIIGIDVNTGVNRFDFGIPRLMDGLNLIALAMGVFGVVEVILNADTIKPKINEKVSLKDMLPTKQELKRSTGSMARGSGVGCFFGSLPGTGAAIASFMAYALEKKVSKEPEKFGKGAIEGVTAPESANNGAAITGFIPTLSLGIPGDAVMALVLGALILHGIQPGPLLVVEHPSLFWGLIVSFALGNIFLLILNIPLVNVWVSLLKIPYYAIYPAILIFISLGVYSVNNSVFDVFVVTVIGAVGYVLRELKFEATPILLGFILGPILEENMRRALLISGGDMSVFITRPISAAILAVCFALVAFSLSKNYLDKKRFKNRKETV